MIAKATAPILLKVDLVALGKDRRDADAQAIAHELRADHRVFGCSYEHSVPELVKRALDAKGAADKQRLLHSIAQALGVEPAEQATTL